MTSRHLETLDHHVPVVGAAKEAVDQDDEVALRGRVLAHLSDWLHQHLAPVTCLSACKLDRRVLDVLLTEATGFWPASPTGPARNSPLSPATGEVTTGQIRKALVKFGYRSKRLLLPCVPHTERCVVMWSNSDGLLTESDSSCPALPNRQAASSPTWLHTLLKRMSPKPGRAGKTHVLAD